MATDIKRGCGVTELGLIDFIILGTGASVWFWTALELNWGQCTQVFALLTQPLKITSPLWIWKIQTKSNQLQLGCDQA